MKNILSDLGLDKNHAGTATGLNWLNSGKKSFNSYSPVDGEKIGSEKTDVQASQ